jgi:hypothetical protein
VTGPGLLEPVVEAFYEPLTFSVQYVVSCPLTRRCAIIDPVFDFDEKSGIDVDAQCRRHSRLHR